MTIRSPSISNELSDVATEVDGLRHLVARVDAMVSATEDLLERGIWCDEDGEDADGRRLERLGHLVSGRSRVCGRRWKPATGSPWSWPSTGRKRDEHAVDHERARREVSERRPPRAVTDILIAYLAQLAPRRRSR
jgi:hypothetical protein